MPARIYDQKTIITRLGEVFRDHGFEGASMTEISKATGLGKGSLYHAFPGGKEQMAEAVLADIDQWFETNVFRPLADEEKRPLAAVQNMLDACETYFRNGGRVCLVGVFALGSTRDRFSHAIASYFHRWHDALRTCLSRANLNKRAADDLSEEILSRIQGGLIIARAFDDPSCFGREIDRLRNVLRKKSQTR